MKINILLFLLAFLLATFKIISVTPIEEIKQDVDKGYLLLDSKPTVSKTSSNLEKIGLKIGDSIVSINKKSISDQRIIRELFLENRGNEIEIELIRNKEIKIINSFIPMDFESFGYESDVNFSDKSEVKKSPSQIIIYHLYEKQFEENKMFLDINKKVYFSRLLSYMSSLLLIIASFGFLFNKKISWYFVGGFSFISMLLSILFFKNLTTVIITLAINFLILIFLFYSLKKNPNRPNR